MASPLDIDQFVSISPSPSKLLQQTNNDATFQSGKQFNNPSQHLLNRNDSSDDFLLLSRDDSPLIQSERRDHSPDQTKTIMEAINNNNNVPEESVAIIGCMSDLRDLIGEEQMLDLLEFVKLQKKSNRLSLYLEFEVGMIWMNREIYLDLEYNPMNRCDRMKLSAPSY